MNFIGAHPAILDPRTSSASISNRDILLSWSEQGLSLSETQSQKMIFANAFCRVNLWDGTGFDLPGNAQVGIDPPTPRVTFQKSIAGLKVAVSCVLDGRKCAVSLRITNTRPDAVRLGDVHILDFRLQAGSRTHLLAEPCDIFSLGASTGETDEVWSKSPGNKRVFAFRLSRNAPAYASDNILAAKPLRTLDLTPHAVFSFDRIAEVASGISIDLTNGVAAARAAFRGSCLPVGGTRVLPTLFIDGISPIQEALDEAADRVASIYKPRIFSEIPSGWCSWYYYYADVSESDILENLNFLKKNRERFRYQYIQIDDGYQLHWGDWLLPGKKFPHDMAWLAEKIRTAGLKPGIWVAPLIATVPSNLFRNHPEWALKDFETGRPRILQGWSSEEENPWVILDGTNPEFQDHLRKVFHTMAHEWGYEYFKLDATAFGAYAGIRWDPTKTGIEGVRMAIDVIREAIGPDKYILGCGIPFGAAIGLVNGERVSDDISTAFRADQFICPIEVSMPQSIHRSFVHGKWWHNDPDCVLVRSEGTPFQPALSKEGLSDEEAKFFITVVGLTQGIQMVGEKLDALEEERLRLLDAIQPQLSSPAIPQDLFSPQPGRLLVQTPYGTLLGLLNWKHVENIEQVCWSEIGFADDESLNVYELWTNKCIGISVCSLMGIAIPAHAARILFFRKSECYPSFLGFDGHVSCGSTLIRDEAWNAETKSLSIDFHANRAGILKFHVPPHLVPLTSQLYDEGSGVWSIGIGKGTLSITLRFAEEGSCHSHSNNANQKL